MLYVGHNTFFVSLDPHETTFRHQCQVIKVEKGRSLFSYRPGSEDSGEFFNTPKILGQVKGSFRKYFVDGTWSTT